MDTVSFNDVCLKFTGTEHEREGIGTLSEKTSHLILKNYIEPNTQYHEIKVGRRIADIKIGNNITEIQTRAFNLLRPKLAQFLPNNKVTVVFPVAQEKRLCWLDPETGEITDPRKSPKKGSAFDIFPELYRIKMFLHESNLSFRIMLLGVNEYRLRNGWSQDGKKGSSRYEQIPNTLFDEIKIESPVDYLKLLPENLPEIFGSKELAKAAKRTVYRAQTALNVLTHVGAISRIPSEDRSYRYVINKFN